MEAPLHHLMAVGKMDRGRTGFYQDLPLFSVEMQR
jgi:hypothetical protein